MQIEFHNNNQFILKTVSFLNYTSNLGKVRGNILKIFWFASLKSLGNTDCLYNKRACPQTMFLRLRRQRCQIKRITGLPRTWGRERERELKIKIRGGGGHLQRTGRPN
jgi:hypothetical protein